MAKYIESTEKIQRRVDELNEIVLKIEELDEVRWVRLDRLSKILVKKLKGRYLGRTITVSGRDYEVLHITTSIPRLFCYENEIDLFFCLIESNVTDMTTKEKELIKECRTLKEKLMCDNYDHLDEYRDNRLLEIISDELHSLSHKYGKTLEFCLETGAEGFAQCMADPSIENLLTFRC